MSETINPSTVSTNCLSVKSVIDGIGDFLKSENPDIILIEEVDKKATRSYHYDQDKALRGKLDGYDSILNFDKVNIPA